jgi:hypothetical protein
MRTARHVLRLMLAVALFAGGSAKAEAEYVSLWGGGGVGTMLTGAGSVYVNGHKMGVVSVALPGGNFRLRLLKGSLERTDGIESDTGRPQKFDLGLWSSQLS